MSPAESGSVSGLAALADKRGSHDHDGEAGPATTGTSAAPAASGPSAAIGAGARAGAAATAPAARQALAEESSDEDDDAKRLQFKVIVLGDGTVGKTSLLHRFAFSSFERSYKQTVGVDFFSREVTLPTRSSGSAAASVAAGGSGVLAGQPAAAGGGAGSGGSTAGSTTAVLSVWDIGGQNAGSKMLRPYIAGAHAVLLAYDITNADSFYHLEDWLEDVRASFPDAGTVPPPSSSAASSSGSLSSRNRGATYAAPAAGGAGGGGAARSRRRGPLLGVVGNKTDEAYLRAIKPGQHRELCDRLGAHCFLVSAKTGDGVAQMFFRVAAELAGIDVTRGEVAASGGPIPATIVAYANGEDAGASGATATGAGASGSGSGSETAATGAGGSLTRREDGAAAAEETGSSAGPAAAAGAGRRRGGKGDHRDRDGKCTVQ